MSRTPEERIDELESRLAFQDDTITTLDRALADQQRQISQLEKALAEVLARIREEDLDLDFPVDDARPPHY